MARKKRGKLAKVPKPSKSSKKSSRILKHKKSNKSLWAVSIFAFFLFAFLLGVINVPQIQTTGNVADAGGGGSAGTSQATPPVSTGNGFIADFFANWNAGTLDIHISKYLLWAIVLMFIASVLAFVGFPPNGFLQFILALIVSFLAVAFITPNEVFVMLTQYSALGLTIGTIIPFMIIMFTSAMLMGQQKGRISVGKFMLEVILWLLWTAFMIYRLVNLIIQQGIMYVIQGGGIVIAVVTILSILILIFNRGFRKWLRKLGIESIRARAEVQQEERREEVEAGRKAEHWPGHY